MMRRTTVTLPSLALSALAAWVHGCQGGDGKGGVGETAETPEEDCLVVVEWDYPVDGTPDYQITYYYDSNQNLFNAHHEDGGIVYAVETYTLDTEGHVLSYEYDNGADGTPDYQESFTYDVYGNLLYAEVGSDGWVATDEHLDQQGNFLSLATFRYDGLIVTADYDMTDDSSTEARWIRTYNENHNVLSSATYWFPDTVSEFLDRWYNYEYDTQGRLGKIEKDYDADGTVDTTVSYAYDTDGRLATLDYHDDIGRPGDARGVYSYPCSIIDAAVPAPGIEVIPDYGDPTRP